MPELVRSSPHLVTVLRVLEHDTDRMAINPDVFDFSVQRRLCTSQFDGGLLALLCV
ncbi:hypothetical protein [Haladaptatus pallidirubidus]|uniref:hypothetical protein n=1 Tax=Haladaptatus pallidirubidus TaxID=1008152 RepID=UPI001D1153F7|nr:hypothetical protein [Haladaptatus pallidirubidus]